MRYIPFSLIFMMLMMPCAYAQNNSTENSILIEDRIKAYERSPSLSSLWMIYINKKDNPRYVQDWLVENSKTDSQVSLFAGRLFVELQEGSRAIQYFESAWNRGQKDAAYELADLYLNGNIVQKSKKESCEWRKKYVEKNPNSSQATEYGVCLDSSVEKIQSFSQSLKQACEWYGRGAESNYEWHDNAKKYPEFSFGTGRAYVMYAICLGDKQYASYDLKGSALWAQRAMEVEHPFGTYFYADKLLEGLGLLQNNSDGLRYMNKAAELGSDIAQNAMGIIYAEGKIVPKNMVESYKWFIIALSNGYENSKANKANAEKLLSSNEINLAQQRAKQWRLKFEKK